ncbi:hypothetical protein Egran_02063 [Elaphomyces granulatus]|uniref:MalT-like TPR region domain-containing protein n=1 Tax=Elaphomyces granulatus TaxID=519963 RepID=A0A232M1D7_9EURO|nr:hypothetical protein Egran_02063 [Elaphomyces granulatus]
MEPRSHINVEHGPQLGPSLRGPGQAGRGREDALQGYEKALGLENVARYRPALSTMGGLGDLFATQGHLDEAKEMYSRACTGFRAALGPSSTQCQYLERRIASLDPTQGMRAHGRG